MQRWAFWLAMILGPGELLRKKLISLRTVEREAFFSSAICSAVRPEIQSLNQLLWWVFFFVQTKKRWQSLQCQRCLPLALPHLITLCPRSK